MTKLAILALIAALRAVESTNGTDPKAHGNDLQITEICIRDVNRIYGTDYKHPADSRNYKTAREIALLYLNHYGKQKGVPQTPEAYARIWHRGPTQWRDEQGARYWRKVKKHLTK